jgi:hypothetical protein
MLVLAMAQWGFLTSRIANAKNRDTAKWFAIGALLPLIGLALAIAAPSVPRTVAAPQPKRKIPARLERLRPAISSF